MSNLRQQYRVNKLSTNLISQIAAGEVVESPVSILKELVENSIDAHASRIHIDIHDIGFSHIKITDDGCGIHKDDLPLVLQSFTTSKLSHIDDIQSLQSLGFRGEALGAIASVADVTIESKFYQDEYAYKINTQDNKVYISSLDKGTYIYVTRIFHNIPVRKEFQKSSAILKKDILELVTNLSLSNFMITFIYTLDGIRILHAPSVKYLSNRIESLHGNNLLDNLIPFFMEEEELSVEGYISNFSSYRSNASMVRLFVNGRIIKYKPMVGLLKHVYGELMPPNKFPVAYILLTIPPHMVDVNVHPQKHEVRFKDEVGIRAFLRKAILNAIEGKGFLKISNISQEKTFHASVTNDTKSSVPHQPKHQFNFSHINISRPEAISLPSNLQPNNVSFPSHLHTQLYGTFILGSSEEGVFLIDQHTAHERINYEKFLFALENRSKLSQPLLTPMKLILSEAEKDFINSNQVSLYRLGFTIEDLGPAGFALSTVPFYVKTNEEEQALDYALKGIQEGKMDSMELFRHMAASLACRHSIKKGDEESLFNFAQLTELLRECQNPSRCPHGRPTMIWLDRADIMQLFKRKRSS